MADEMSHGQYIEVIFQARCNQLRNKANYVDDVNDANMRKSPPSRDMSNKLSNSHDLYLPHAKI